MKTIITRIVAQRLCLFFPKHGEILDRLSLPSWVLGAGGLGQACCAVVSDKQCVRSAAFARGVCTGRVLLRALPLQLQAPGGASGCVWRCVGLRVRAEPPRCSAGRGRLRGWCPHRAFSLGGLPAPPLGTSPRCVGLLCAGSRACCWSRCRALLGLRNVAEKG